MEKADPQEQQRVFQALNGAFHQLLWGYSKWFLLILIIAYAVSGFYKLERDSIGVLTRVGKVVEPNVSPGLHYKFPWPVDRIYKVPVKEVKTMIIQDFGSRYQLKEGDRSYEFYTKTSLEPYCISGDNNIVAITVVLKYTIANPVDYLFGLKHPERFVQKSAANLVIQQLAHLRIDEVLTYGKKQFEFNLLNELVEVLERYRTGIRISFLEIKEIAPPKKVQDSFDRVINAEVNKKKALNEAQGYFNRIVPDARSKANALIQEAEAYKQEKILTAEGETSRFMARMDGYSENPTAHKEKIYLEFIQKLYPNLKEIRVVDGSKTNENMMVPLGLSAQ